jgi:signal transduction histidine kinase
MNLSEHPFIQSISEDHRRAAILGEVEAIELVDGDTIFDEASKPDSLYLVLEGSVTFTKRREDGSLKEISQSTAGSFFGEVGIFTGEPRALGAQAQGLVTVAKVPKSTVQKIIGDLKPVKLILENVASHLKSTTTHYMDEMVSTEKLALVGTMISTILHDFRNPFSTISLAATLIEQKHGDEPQTLKLCRNIDSQIRRMVQMANDISAFSRGDQQIDVGNVSLSDLFQHFEDLNTPFFKDETVQLTMIARDVSLEGDADKLLRVLQNLIFNAREALNAAQMEGQINVVASDLGERILLSVRDNGPGIPKEIQANLFDAFVTFGKRGGTGLGTSIVKSIVEAHHGTIDFETNAQGTCFNITLPKTHTEA